MQAKMKVKQRTKLWTSPKKKKTLQKRRSIKKTGAEEDSGSGSSPSSEDEETAMVAKPKHLLKPPKFDGVKPFETFWAQFKNCAEYNQWNKRQKLVYLRNSLDLRKFGRMSWTIYAGTEPVPRLSFTSSRNSLVFTAVFLSSKPIKLVPACPPRITFTLFLNVLLHGATLWRLFRNFSSFFAVICKEPN